MTLRLDRQILFSLWLLMFASSNQVMVIALLLSSIGEEFSVATAALGNLLTVYAAAVGVSALVAGPVSDVRFVPLFPDPQEVEWLRC